MKRLTRNETAAFLAQNDHYTILSHRRPDGDTLGSCALLCLALRQLGKTAHILRNPELTPKYAHLMEGLTKDAPETGDVLISVDVASEKMLPANYTGEVISLRIDHHGSASSFTEAELVDPDAAACGEVVYDVVTDMGAKLDEAMANALYTAISTDTGCFRYANTTANTFRVASICAEAGANVFGINQRLFDTNTLARLRLQGWLVENARFVADGRFVICPLPKDVEARLGVTEDDMENISGFPRSIEGVQIAVTIRQETENTVKASFRAVPGYDAGAIAAAFGGGGHKGAAGASMKMTMDEAVAAVIAALPPIEKC